MKRAAVLTIALLGVLGVLPAAAQQSGKTYVVGVLSDTAMVADEAPVAALRRKLAGLGYNEGKNLKILYRSSTDYKQLPELAAGLVRAKVDVIVVAGTPAITAAHHATSSIPIVMTSNPDPVGAGLVLSLARPGGNITGLENMGAELTGKELQLLRELIPHLQCVAVLLNRSNRGNLGVWRSLSSTARSTGIQLVEVDIRSPAQIDAAFKTLPQLRPGALMVLNDGVMLSNAAHVVQLIAARRVPAVYGLPQYTDAGGLMSYGASADGLWIQVASYVDRILKGASPADLPVENPTTFQLIVNLKTAHNLGLTVPQSILLRATQVIR